MFISICIPTYNEPVKIKKLLESITVQTYTNYEIIITDDSNNHDTQTLVLNEFKQLPINYIKNQLPKGSPENWNFSISLAKGEWIKIMHHDDWFCGADSLAVFAQCAAGENQDVDFIFSAYRNVDLNKNKSKNITAGFFSRLLLKKNPLFLFRKNIVGNPSCTCIRRKVFASIIFDKDLKWIVDFEFYTRAFTMNPHFVYIDKTLVNVGIHDKQVTAYVQLNPDVEIPEAMHFLQVHGSKVLRNIFVYDYYWRLLRNLNIRSVVQFNEHNKRGHHNAAIERIIHRQAGIKNSTLKIGVMSKLLMGISFFKNLSKN